MVLFNLVVLLMLSLGGVVAHTSYISEEAEKIEAQLAEETGKDAILHGLLRAEPQLALHGLDARDP